MRESTARLKFSNGDSGFDFMGVSYRGRQVRRPQDDGREYEMDDEQAVAIIIVICDLLGKSVMPGEAVRRYQFALNQARHNRPLKDDAYGDE